MSKTKQRFKLSLIIICFLLLVVLMTVAFVLGTEGTGSLPEPSTPTISANTAPAKKQKVNLWEMISDALEGEKVKETEEITKRTSKVADADKPSVYICGLGNWGTANHLTSSSGYAPFKIAKVNNVTDSMSFVGNVVLEEEIFVSQGKFTDVIILDAAAVKNLKPLLADDPTLFDSYKAWQNGEVYLEMAYNAYYTNYEIALINTWFVAKCVYPDLFGDLDMTEKTNEITEKFLGKALAEEIFACPSSFGGYQKIDLATFFK